MVNEAGTTLHRAGLADATSPLCAQALGITAAGPQYNSNIASQAFARYNTATGIAIPLPCKSNVAFPMRETRSAIPEKCNKSKLTLAPERVFEKDIRMNGIQKNQRCADINFLKSHEECIFSLERFSELDNRLAWVYMRKELLI